MEIAILEGKSTVEGVVKKIDNILHGSNNSDISEPEKRRYEEIKGDILRFKTAPEMTLIAEGDLGDKKVQEQLGIGGKFNPDDPNLPLKIRERIEEARSEGREVTYFYDKVTGKIYINENADENTVRSGIAREWGIRDRFEKGKAKPNTEGDLKATVAEEIAYSEIENRLKGKGNKGINLDNFDYAVFDSDSEITSDIASAVNNLRMLEAKHKVKETLSQKYTDKNKYFAVLSEFGKYSGSTKGNPYEALYMTSSDVRKNVMNEKGYLNVKDFDPEGWERVSKREEYTTAISETLEKGKNEALKELQKNPNIKNKEVPSEKASISSGFKLVGSESGIIGNKVAKTLEYALGSSVVTGTAIIDRKVKSNGEIELKINVRYNLSDAFEDTFGIKNRKYQLNKILGKKFFDEKKE